MSEKPTLSVSSTAQPRLNRGQNTGMNTKGLESLIPTKAGSESSAQNSSSVQSVNLNPDTLSASVYKAHEVTIYSVEGVKESDSALGQSVLEQFQKLGMNLGVVARAFEGKEGVVIKEVNGSAAIKDQEQLTSAIGKRGEGEIIAYNIEKREVREDHLLDGLKSVTGQELDIVSEEILVERPVVAGVRLVTRQQPKLEEAPVNNQPQFNNNPVSNEQLNQITQLNANPQPAPAGNPFLNPDKVTFTYLSEEEKKAA